MVNHIATSREEIDSFFDTHGNISGDNYTQLGGVLARSSIVEVLEQIADDDQEADRIAERSYIHSQGFSKIIITDGRKEGLGGHGGADYKHRLHLWPREKARKAGAPLIEMKHEHKWDFVSRVLLGKMEDHWYKIRDLDPQEAEVFRKFERALSRIPKEQIAAICERIDLMETISLAETKSQLPRLQGGLESIISSADIENLQSTLGMTLDELKMIVRILVKYSNQRNPSGKEVYNYDGPRFFEPTDLIEHQQESLRIHPIERAHRLIIDPSEYVATSVITGIPYPDRRPGEFVRSNVGKIDGDERSRVYYTRETLRRDLKDCLAQIV